MKLIGRVWLALAVATITLAPGFALAGASPERAAVVKVAKKKPPGEIRINWDPTSEWPIPLAVSYAVQLPGTKLRIGECVPGVECIQIREIQDDEGWLINIGDSGVLLNNTHRAALSWAEQRDLLIGALWRAEECVTSVTEC